jgi:hypothetical protein
VTGELVTEVMVTALPVDHPANRYYAVWVQWAGNGRYAVRSARNMSPTDAWDVEAKGWVWGRPDEDATDEERAAYFARSRFTLERAIEIAREIAPTMTCNGCTVTDALGMDRRAW